MEHVWEHGLVDRSAKIVRRHVGRVTEGHRTEVGLWPYHVENGTGLGIACSGNAFLDHLTNGVLVGRSICMAVSV